MFVYNPYLLLKGDILHIILGCFTALVRILGLSAGVQGYFVHDLNVAEKEHFFVSCS